MLTQEHTHIMKDKEIKILHPITYQSGLFKGSQVNWATLTKEAHAIYMAVCKLDYYLVDADITLHSDHLPLKKFLQKNTLNSKVNNWAIEISPFKIKFEYIKGIKNTLADTMSHLVAIDPSIQNENEPYGCEFGYYVFDTLPPIEIEVIMVGNQLPSITLTDVEEHTKTLFHTDQITTIEKALEEHLMGEKLEELSELQGNDLFCKNIISKLNSGRLQTHNPYFIEHDVLKRKVQYNGQSFHPIVLPMCLTQHILRLAHDQLGHNGLNHTYNALRPLYFWKGMKPSLQKHIKNCNICQKRNTQIIPYAQLHFDSATFPMEFISMDLIGEFSPPSKDGYRYALTVICMLSGYVFCVPLKTKSAAEVIQAYIDNVYAKFSGSLKILSDNGTEFKNKLFEDIAKQLGVRYKKYTPPYMPSSNGHIKGFHNFLKACISKHVSAQLEWTDVLPLTCAAYNFLPNEHSHESPFFIMFGRDPVLPLNLLLSPRLRYLGNDLNLLSLQALQNMFHIVAENLRKAQSR